MEKLPNELWDMIITKLHDDFCRCQSSSRRPSGWEMRRLPVALYWDIRVLKPLQMELCKLRLVSKKFHAAATRYLLSHGTFVFDMDYLGSTSAIEERIDYCMSDENKSILGRVSGLHLQLGFSSFIRVAQMAAQLPGSMDSREATVAQTLVAEAATEELARSLPDLTARFKSVTALDIRLDETETASYDGYLEAAINSGFPKLEDLQIRGRTNGILRVLDSLTAAQCSQLRRLVLCAHSFRDTQAPGVIEDAIKKFKNITELGIRAHSCQSLELHDQHRGLTRLRLSRVYTSATRLISILTKGPRPTGNDLSSDSSLVDFVLIDVRIGQPQALSDEPNTWSSVFKAARERCPKLTFFRAEGLAYSRGDTGPVLQQPLEIEHKDDEELEKLVVLVRSRAGGYASALSYSTAQAKWRRF